jgi:hypothetical protein
MAIATLAIVGCTSSDDTAERAPGRQEETIPEAVSTTTTVVPQGTGNTPATANEESVASLWLRATLSDSDSADIAEVIEWDFAGAPGSHGIYREVPGLPSDAPVTADADDVPDDLLVQAATIDGQPGASIRIGDPNTTVSGRHTYTLGYPLPGVVTGQRFAWNAVGTDWDVPIGPTEIHVIGPFELTDVTCSRGPVGSAMPCGEVQQIEPGHVEVTVESLAVDDGITITGQIGAPLPAPPEAPQPPE